ncbi:MAG: hypothetical protein Q9190_000632 [Brigantiaea leucoxantha]
MSPSQARSNVKNSRGRTSALNQSNTQIARPCPVQREESSIPVRKSARLQKDTCLHQHAESPEQALQLPSPTSIIPDGEILLVNTKDSGIDPTEHWIKEGTWLGANFEGDSNMSHSLTRKTSTLSISIHESDTSGVSLREGKNLDVKSRRYEQLLVSAGIYMGQPEPHLRASKADKALCQLLLSKEQPTPKDSLFNDDLFESTCEDIANRNEAKVIQDIGRLIVPAPEELFRRGTTQFKHLIETVDDNWIKSIPLVKGPRP